MQVLQQLGPALECSAKKHYQAGLYCLLSEDPDQMIWVCSICLDLSIPIYTVSGDTVMHDSRLNSSYMSSFEGLLRILQFSNKEWLPVLVNIYCK